MKDNYFLRLEKQHSKDREEILNLRKSIITLEQEKRCFPDISFDPLLCLFCDNSCNRIYKNIGFISNFVENGIKFGKSVYVKS